MEPITYTSGDRTETQQAAIQQVIKVFGIGDELSIEQVEVIVALLIQQLCEDYGFTGDIKSSRVIADL